MLRLVSRAGKLYFVDRPGQTQANIALGEVGIDMLDPDAFALDVLGDIMNGFGGRLFDELRSREVLLRVHLSTVFGVLLLPHRFDHVQTHCDWHPPCRLA